jgi:hypothetical protein
MLNLFDGLMTLLWICSSLTEEMNPLMDAIIQYHPVLFAIVKVGFVNLLIYYIYINKNTQLKTKLINFVLAVYLTLFSMHVYFAIWLVYFKMI